MSEEHGPYHLHPDNPEPGLAGVEHIGDVLRQLIQERGWPPMPGHTRADGHSAGGNDHGRHPDA